MATKTVSASVELERSEAPREVHLKFRLPSPITLMSVTVNGQSAVIDGPHSDTAIITSGGRRRCEVVGQAG